MPLPVNASQSSDYTGSISECRIAIPATKVSYCNKRCQSKSLHLNPVVTCFFTSILKCRMEIPTLGFHIVTNNAITNYHITDQWQHDLHNFHIEMQDGNYSYSHKFFKQITVATVYWCMVFMCVLFFFKGYFMSVGVILIYFLLLV